MTKSHFIKRCSSLSVVMAQGLNKLCFGCGYGYIRGRKWRDFFVYLLNYFTCTSHPHHEGDHSVSFSHQELFLTVVGKIKIMSACPFCLTFFDKNDWSEGEQLILVTKVISVLVALARDEDNLELPHSGNLAWALSSRATGCCAWLCCPLVKWTIKLVIPQAVPDSGSPGEDLSFSCVCTTLRSMGPRSLFALGELM